MLGYILLAGSISAAFLYRLGPPSHPRTLDLLQWTLQFLGLTLITLSSHHPLYRWIVKSYRKIKFISLYYPFSTSLALAILGWSIVPGWVKARASSQVFCQINNLLKSELNFQVRKNLWRPRVKLLTEDEYREQSNIETRKALEELRR